MSCREPGPQQGTLPILTTSPIHCGTLLSTLSPGLLPPHETTTTDALQSGKGEVTKRHTCAHLPGNQFLVTLCLKQKKIEGWAVAQWQNACFVSMKL